VSEQEPKYWNNVQAYGMAVICLALGIAAGYLLHAPAVASPSVRATEIAAPATQAAPQMPSAADMKRMADKQVAPMLEQLQKTPKDPELLAKIAHAYMAAQQFQTAKQYYEQSLAVKLQSEVLNELAFVYVKLGDLDRAIVTLNKAVAVDPKNVHALFNLGYFEWKGKADPQAAITAWQKLLKVDPKNPKRADVEKMIAQAQKHLSIPAGTKTEKPAM